MKVPHPGTPSRRPRPPRLPLPSLHAAERVRGAGILEESTGDGCGVVLWESFRNVTDWAATPRARRTGDLFGPGAAERRTALLGSISRTDGCLRRALETVRDLLADPAGAEPRAVAYACTTVAAWAAAHGRPATRFYFAAAGAACVPEDARQAYDAGCVARDLARWDAAEQWLEYALAAAKRRRDRVTQAMAVIGVGNAFYRQGFYHRAREAQTAGLTLARKYRLKEMQARAHHDLFITSAELHEAERAEEHARLALQAYGAAHRNVPALAHDVARFWLELGHASRALTVVTALLPHMKRPIHRLYALSSLAWAAGGCGRQEAFESAWNEVWAAAALPGAGAAAASALLQLAYGAAALGEVARAEAAATAALRIAAERGEQEEVATATAFLDSLSAGSPSLVSACAADIAEGSNDSLAEEFVQTLAVG
ncbi:MAG TPA: hypothetical protein VGR37_18110 [Longimicrobiaceae bacterium]|nr:hypothetical protein [Longimicrobiaceae bacterium]